MVANGMRMRQYRPSSTRRSQCGSIKSILNGGTDERVRTLATAPSHPNKDKPTRCVGRADNGMCCT